MIHSLKQKPGPGSLLGNINSTAVRVSFSAKDKIQGNITYHMRWTLTGKRHLHWKWGGNGGGMRGYTYQPKQSSGGAGGGGCTCAQTRNVAVDVQRVICTGLA